MMKLQNRISLTKGWHHSGYDHLLYTVCGLCAYHIDSRSFDNSSVQKPENEKGLLFMIFVKESFILFSWSSLACCSQFMFPRLREAEWDTKEVTLVEFQHIQCI